MKKFNEDFSDEFCLNFFGDEAKEVVRESLKDLGEEILDINSRLLNLKSSICSSDLWLTPVLQEFLEKEKQGVLQKFNRFKRLAHLCGLLKPFTSNQNFIDYKEIKSATPIQYLALSYLKPGRVKNFYFCPKHDENHASLSLDVVRNQFRCFSCDWHGSNVDFIMGVENTGFKDSLKILKEKFN